MLKTAAIEAIVEGFVRLWLLQALMERDRDLVCSVSRVSKHPSRKTQRADAQTRNGRSAGVDEGLARSKPIDALRLSMHFLNEK